MTEDEERRGKGQAGCNRLISGMKLIAIIAISLLLLWDSFALAEKGRDIIIDNGRVILKGGKKKGNIVITHGHHGSGGQGKYKYKKKYMDYGGFWR